MSVKKRIKELQLNTGKLEAKEYTFYYNIFQPEDLKSDQAISSIFHSYISSVRKGLEYGPFISEKSNKQYNDAFRKHIIGRYGLTDEQIDKGEMFTPEQITKFRKNLSRHLNSAYKRVFSSNAKVAPLFYAAAAVPAVGAGLLFAPIGLGILAFAGAAFSGTIAASVFAVPRIKAALIANKSAKKVARNLPSSAR